MVNTYGQAQLQPRGTIWTAEQPRYDLNDLDHVSIQNSHPNGGYIRVLFGLEGNLVQVFGGGELLSGRASPWSRFWEAPAEELTERGLGTESTCTSFVNHVVARANWTHEAIHIAVRGSSSGTSGITLSDQVSSRPYRGMDVNRPPASLVADHLIEGMPCSEEVVEFSKGLYGQTPTEGTIRTANRIFKATTQRSTEYDFYIDDLEGSLGFMARLNNGLLLLAELSPDGTLSGGTYVDNENEAREVKFLPKATVEEIMDLF